MKSLTLVLLGLEQPDSQHFRSEFNGLDRQARRRWSLLADNAEADADLTVIDIDSIHGHMDWLKATAAGHRTAVYTSARHAKESDLILQKPLTAENLGAVLDTAAAEHGEEIRTDPVSGADTVPAAAEPAGPDTRMDSIPAAPAEPESRESRPSMAVPVSREQRRSEPVHIAPETSAKAAPEPKPEPEPPRKAAPKPEPKSEPKTEAAPNPEPQPTSIGAWLRAGKVTEPTSISVNDQRWVLDPDRDAYHGPVALKPLLAALSRPMESLQPADVVALESARKEPSQPLPRLRWLAGLNASPGQLLPELAGATSFRLGRWPQIEREYPRHFRIATAMMKQAGGVDDITQASGAPRTDVVDFINAYHTLGYIIREGGVDDSVETTKATVMSRIRKPFGR